MWQCMNINWLHLQETGIGELSSAMVSIEGGLS